MNQKLKQKLSELYERDGYVGGFNAALGIAEHFYSLALADVREEVEEYIKSLEYCPLVVADFGAGKKREGKIQAYKDILSFIDNLTK